MEDEPKKRRGSAPPEEGAREPRAGERATREPTREGSRGNRASQAAWLRSFARRLVAAGPLAWVVLLVGLAAAVLMIATEFSTIQSISIGESTCGAADAEVQDVCETGGGDQHGYALLALGLLAGLMTLGAVLGRSRPAAIALIVIGVVVLLVALLLDAPTLDDTRGLEARYNDVATHTGGGYTLELIAGALGVAAGALGLLLSTRARAREEARREARRSPPRVA